MAIQIRTELGSRKRERGNTMKLGIARNALGPRRSGSYSMLSSCDIFAGSENPEASITRTSEALLLRRAQMLK